MTDLADLISGGQVLRMARWGEPVLHETTQPVTLFDDDLHRFLQDMFATMAAAEGVGLAATQVSDNRSIFIYHCMDDDDRIHTGVVINPEIELPQGKDRQLVAALARKLGAIELYLSKTGRVHARKRIEQRGLACT